MPNFLTYSKFHTGQEASEFTTLLEHSRIEYEIVHERDPLDKVYTGESFDPMITVKIPEHRFEEVNKIMLSKAKLQLTDIDPNYYLFHFSNQELIDVINSPNEWNHFDQALAHKILSDKKIDIAASATINPKEDIYIPIHMNSLWLILEYALTLLIPYVGIVIGLSSNFAYKTTNSGKKIKMYDKATQMHAIIMLILGIIRTCLFLFGFFLFWEKLIR